MPTVPVSRPLAPTVVKRRAKRHLTVLMVGKVRGPTGEYACVVNDVSRFGMKARFPHPPATGDRLSVSLRDLPELAATVRWIDGRRAGLEFDQPLDLSAFMGVGIAKHLPRTPRFACDRDAILMLGGERRAIDLIDISLGGAKLAPDIPFAPGSAGRWAALTLPALAGPRAGAICWANGDRAGFRFAMPLTLDALAAVLAGAELSATPPAR